MFFREYILLWTICLVFQAHLPLSAKLSQFAKPAVQKKTYTYKAQASKQNNEILDTAILWHAPPYQAMAESLDAEAELMRELESIKVLYEGAKEKYPKIFYADKLLTRHRKQNSWQLLKSMLNQALTLALDEGFAISQLSAGKVKSEEEAQILLEKTYRLLSQEFSIYRQKYFVNDMRNPKFKEQIKAAKDMLLILAGAGAVNNLDDLYLAHKSTQQNEFASAEINTLSPNLSLEEFDLSGNFRELSKAKVLRVAYGRLSLIDLGSLMLNEPVVLDESLVRVYKLSALSDEGQTSVLAIQGLQSSGSTDLVIKTARGVERFHLNLNPMIADDIVLDPNNYRCFVLSDFFTLNQKHLTIIEARNYVNEYVLAGNPGAVNVKQLVDSNDPDFLKLFALSANPDWHPNVQPYMTDIVVATKSGVFKFQIAIGGAENYAEKIYL